MTIASANYTGLIRRYRAHLPVGDEFIVSLSEGNTPLLECQRLRDMLNLPCRLFLKLEGLNPTGSFKDRGMTYAISKACERGAKAVICASTGNTSASAAAYAARAGIKAFVLIPKGKIAFGKLAQAIQHGANILQIDGNFDQALNAVIEIGKGFPVTIVNSVNPDRIQGQMTAAFEIITQLGCVPDYHFLPVGNAGNITAYWCGYKTAQRDLNLSKLPKMMGFQASGAAPIVKGRAIKMPETIATAIRIGNPASWQQAVAARDESGGVIQSVTDHEILKAYDLVAKLEGYFCEPASAASIAGVIKMAKKKLFVGDEIVVCTLTGHGLKDPDLAVERAIKPKVCSDRLSDIIKKMGL